MVVMATSRHKKDAWQFINFLQRPKNAAKLSGVLNFATTNKAAKKYISDFVLRNKAIYPDSEGLKKSEFLQALPPRALNKMNRIFSQLVRP
jgi:spermidine/putrescine transport system substrate-binding protein